MTGRAVRIRRRVRDNCVVLPVTTRALPNQTEPVRAGISARNRVGVIGRARTPRGRRVAVIAFQRGVNKVPGSFASRVNVVMTLAAGSYHLRVIDTQRGRPATGRTIGMTLHAIVRGVRMNHRFGVAAGTGARSADRRRNLAVVHDRNLVPARRCRVVACIAQIGRCDVIHRPVVGVATGARAGTQNLGVIDTQRRSPLCRAVARFAAIRGARVSRRLVVGVTSSAGATAAHFIVIDVARGPGCGHVAGIAGVAGSDVIRSLACSHLAVMTRHATAGDLRVVHGERRPVCIGTVAGFAHVRTQNMAGAFAARARTVMTAYAVINDAIVIELRRRPCRSTVAFRTLARGRDMRRALAYGDYVVMTCRAHTNDLSVIHRLHNPVGVRAMAGFTHRA